MKTKNTITAAEAEISLRVCSGPVGSVDETWQRISYVVAVDYKGQEVWKGGSHGYHRGRAIVGFARLRQGVVRIQPHGDLVLAGNQPVGVHDESPRNWTGFVEEHGLALQQTVILEVSTAAGELDNNARVGSDNPDVEGDADRPATIHRDGAHAKTLQ